MARAMLAALALVCAAPAAAQDVAALGWLGGSWRGSGTAFGRASEARLDVRPVLGGRFIELRYRAGAFEGRAFYRPAEDGRWQATWFDNRGTTFPIEAELVGRTLTANWGSPETERGRTVYRLAEDGRLHVSDYALSPDRSHREFAAHILARAD